MTVDLQQPKELVGGLLFPESPRWHDGKFYFSDMHAHKVMTVDMEGTTEVVVELDNDRPSGLGWLDDGSLLIVAMYGKKLLRFDGKGLSMHADLSSLTGSFNNDMVVDAQGRAYVGARGIKSDGTFIRWGRIILVTPDGETRSVADDLHGPNGTVIFPDGKTLVVAETAGHRLQAFDIEADGSLTNRRLFADLGESTGDGICLDAEGGIWCASPGTAECIRVVEGGEVTHRLTHKDKKPVAPMLGGEGRRTLFLASTRFETEHLAELKRREDDKNSRSRGWIETLTSDFAGAGWP
jgi:sugar lactone lactonase YvrE